MANAGSGKTTALTERVVRLLLLGVAPEHIVCITYTKAAASEMRARVLKKLRELLLMEEAALMARFTQLVGHAPDAAQIQRARLLFGIVLDSPSGGIVLTTIHGFCQNILRRFPLEAGIAPHFTVLEEAAADDLLRKAKHKLLSGLHRADAATNAALSLIGARGGETRFDTLAGDIIRKRRQWQKIWNAHSPESLRTRIFALHWLEADASAKQLNAALAGAFSEAQAAVIRDHLPQLTAHKTKTYREFGEKLAIWMACDHEARVSQCEQFVALFLTQKFTVRDKLLDKKDHPEGSPLAAIIAHACDAALRYRAQLCALHCAEESFAIAVLARALMEQYETAKAARHALDFDDLIARTLQLVSLPETLGWVMSKLDHRIDHLLIDEAQDNSAEQWELARILVEELIAANEGVGHAGLARSLLVVGDEKQSIYSFQGAAPEEFSRNRAAFSAMLEGSPSPLERTSLQDSWRSAEAVLRLVDAVCAAPEIAAALSSQSEVQAHRLKRAEAAGSVTLYAPIAAPEKETLPPMMLPVEYLTHRNATVLLAEEIAGRIAGWLAEKRPLVSEGRALHAGDILILVRNRTRVVQALIRALERRGVPVAGIDRLTLSNHLAVADLLALLRWCENTSDDLALAQVLRSPLVGMSDDALRAVAFGREGSLWAAVSNDFLSRLLTLRQLSPYDFLTHVLEISGRRRDFARRFGEEVHEVLDELKAQAAALPVGLAPTLAQFRDWLENSNRQIKREQETGEVREVRIMTVHGAKGLEAPVVILADTVTLPDLRNERFFTLHGAGNQLLPVLAISAPARESARYAEAKAEKLAALTAEYYRLLYVALTRARDELHIFGTADKKGEVKAGSWYQAVETAMQSLDAEAHDGMLQLQDQRPLVNISAIAEKADTSALPAWLHTAPPAETAAQTVLSPSRLDVMEQAAAERLTAPDARQRGVRIHRILELLRRAEDMRHLQQLARAIAPDWDEETVLQVVAQVAALHVREKWLWDYPRRAEVSISGTVTHAGISVAVSGQVDLIVETPEEIVLIDYKTAMHMPESAAEVPRKTLLQLKLYRDLLRELYPAKRIRPAIIWTHHTRLMWLDEAVENAPYSEIAVFSKSALAA